MSPATARSRSTDKRYYGVVEAIVAESTGDDEGRIKVTFPWFDGSTVTDWCRVAQFYAGNGYGSTFVPEQGDEVAVGFVHGDMRFPVILGGLYNGQDKPHAAPVNGQDQKTIRTKAGHQLTFDDQAGQQAVRVTSAAGHQVELDDQGSEVRVSTAGGASVILDDNGITLHTSGDITLQAGGTVKLVGSSVQLSSDNVTLGSGPLAQQLLLAGFRAHTHASAAGPTGPAILLPTPVPAAQTSQVAAS